MFGPGQSGSNITTKAAAHTGDGLAGAAYNLPAIDDVASFLRVEALIEMEAAQPDCAPQSAFLAEALAFAYIDRSMKEHFITGDSVAAAVEEEEAEEVDLRAVKPLIDEDGDRARNRLYSNAHICLVDEECSSIGGIDGSYCDSAFANRDFSDITDDLNSTPPTSPSSSLGDWRLSAQVQSPDSRIASTPVAMSTNLDSSCMHSDGIKFRSKSKPDSHHDSSAVSPHPSDQQEPSLPFWPENVENHLARAAADFLNMLPRNTTIHLSTEYLASLLETAHNFPRFCSLLYRQGLSFASETLNKVLTQAMWDLPRPHAISAGTASSAHMQNRSFNTTGSSRQLRRRPVRRSYVDVASESEVEERRRPALGKKRRKQTRGVGRRAEGRTTRFEQERCWIGPRCQDEEDDEEDLPLKPESIEDCTSHRFDAD